MCGLLVLGVAFARERERVNRLVAAECNSKAFRGIGIGTGRVLDGS